MKILKSLSILILLTLCSIYSHAENDDDFKKLNPYISYIDGSSLDSIRVVIPGNKDDKDDKDEGKNKSDKDKEKEKKEDSALSTEINFGDGFKSTLFDTTHKYAEAGNYKISIIQKKNNKIKATFEKIIYVNKDLKLVDVPNSTLFSQTNIINNRFYNFNASASQTAKIYKLSVTKVVPATLTQRLVVPVLNFLNLATPLNTISGTITFNGINILNLADLSATDIVQKVVILSTRNSITGTWTTSGGAIFNIQVSEVLAVRDTTPPILAFDSASNSLTNNRFQFFTVTDDSSVITNININGVSSQATQKDGNGVVLKEGLNNLSFQLIDSFGNTSNYNFVNIVLDSIAPTLTSFEPLNNSTIYTNSLPYVINAKATFNESLSASFINGNTATLDSTNKISTSIFQVIQGGQQQISISGTDLAGNISTFTTNLNIIYSTAKPILSLSAANGLRINTNQINLNIKTTSNIPITTSLFLNDVLVTTTALNDFNFLLLSLKEGNNTIKVSSVDAAGNIADSISSLIIVDTRTLQLTFINPINNQNFYTNHLPLTIPIVAGFSDIINSAQVNNLITILSGPTSLSSNLVVNTAGTFPITINVSDLAGNPSSFNENISVLFSDVAPVITINPWLVDLLTYRISIPISGTSDKILSSITLNGLSLNIGPDGKTFTGTFDASADGRYQLNFSGTDLYGNIGTASTYIRVLQYLPVTLENQPGPTLDPNYPHVPKVDYGPHYTPDVCNQLDQMFSISTEYQDTLINITEIDPQPYLKHFPAGYRPKIPNPQGVRNFIGDLSEKLNYVKAGYLAICRGWTLTPPSQDCEENRLYFKLLTGQYPEPMILSQIPAIDPLLYQFIIPRFEICTGLNLDGLKCNDLVNILPFLSNLAMPGVGSMMSNGLVKGLMTGLMCKDYCLDDANKNTPICTGVELPKFPDLPTPKGPTVSFPSPNIDGPDWSFPEGPSGCHWWEDCGTSGPDSPNGPTKDFVCQAFPTLWLCGDITGLPPTTTVSVEPISCNDQLKFSDIFLPGFSTNQSLVYRFTSLVASCLPIIDGFPNISKPIITLIEPVQNQTVDQSVRVRGSVNKIGSKVRINGIDAASWSSASAENFDATVAVPADGIIIIEASDMWGNKADSVRVVVTPLVSAFSGATKISSGQFQTCALTNKNGLDNVYCWGNINADTIVRTPKIVNGLSGNISDIGAGYQFACAIINGGVSCWGTNRRGSLGTNDLNFYTNATPNQVIGLSSGVSSLAVSDSFACVIQLGKVMCWGTATPLGVQVSHPIPTQYFSEEVNTTKISISGTHICATFENKKTKCLGTFGNYDDVINSKEISGINSDIQLLANGAYFSCFSNSLNQVECFGTSNTYGTLGNGVNNYISDTPVTTIGISGAIKSLSASYYNVCAIIDTELKCWGKGDFGALGNGLTTNSSVPVNVTNFTNTPKSVSSGLDHSCVIIEYGQVKCWGSNSRGQLGIGDTTSFTNPSGFRSTPILID